MRKPLLLLMATVFLFELSFSALAAEEKKLKGEKAQVAPGYHKTSQFVGKGLKSLKGGPLGTISDLVVTEDGKIVFVLVTSDGALDIGDKVIPIPWEALMPGVVEGYLTVKVDKATLEKAPKISPDDWPKVGEPDWAKRIYDLFEKESSK